MTPGDGRDWRAITEYHHCCGDWLSAAAAPLAGQRIFTGAADNALVRFSISGERGRQGGSMCIVLILRNRLSTVSATTLLHFAYHVAEEFSFFYLCFRWVDLRSAPVGFFNPVILSSLAGRRRGEARWIRAKYLSCMQKEALAFGECLREVLKDMLLLKDFDLSLFSPDNTSPERLSNFRRFLTHCGKCIPDRVVTIEDSRNAPHAARSLIEPVLKVGIVAADPPLL